MVLKLRLWASAGQTALEKASILVVNGTATASQVLKNLVLPGKAGSIRWRGKFKVCTQELALLQS